MYICYTEIHKKRYKIIALKYSYFTCTFQTFGTSFLHYCSSPLGQTFTQGLKYL